MITDEVRERAETLAGDEGLPAFIYDLGALRSHAAAIRDALDVPGGPELFYAAKANADEPILRALEPYVAGFEVASGGELEHVRRVLPDARLAFGGPGKTDQELATALRLNVERIHVESPYEVARLAQLAQEIGREVDVLLRVNLAGDRQGVALAMSGPFGMDPDAMEACRPILDAAPWVRFRGVHAHLASGLDAPEMVRQSAEILAWARSFGEVEEVNVGGGMAVDYTDPGRLFDWASYAKGVATPDVRLRIEPGRALTAYCGWYVTEVLDVKRAHGDWYAVLGGGTMHLRTPVTKQHDQPFTVIPQSGDGQVGDGPATGGSTTGSPATGGLATTEPATTEPVTLVGRLCTPKDVFARQVPAGRIAVGDVVAFAMAGAYGWNISHHDFLMHPKPGFHYLSERG